jgi:drug/metabolite transporter (DMT)-like permease
LTPHARGLLALVLVTLLWGTTFPLGKIAYKTLTPALLTFGRFVLSAGIMLYQWRGMSVREIRYGLVLGVLQFVCIALVYQGLLTIPANRSAFLVSTASIMVPLAGRLMGRVVTLRVWGAVVLATVGIALMTDPGTGLTLGDWWTILSALAFAIYIFVMERARSTPSPARLTAVQTTVIALCAAVWVIVDGDFTSAGVDRMVGVWPALTYLALSAIVTTLLQGVGQRSVSAQEAAVVFTLEPVFATIFSWLALRETLGPPAMAGAGLVLAANLLAQWRR